MLVGRNSLVQEWPAILCRRLRTEPSHDVFGLRFRRGSKDGYLPATRARERRCDRVSWSFLRYRERERVGEWGKGVMEFSEFALSSRV